MIELHQDDVNAKNEESLRTLSRAIAFSKGQFSLVLARCNYQSLQQRLMQQLRERCSIKFRELVLKPSTATLYTTIQTALDDEQPNAVIVLGLELVNDLDKLLVATNHARDEFRKHFSFPVVLWVTDEVLQKFIRIAPDFTSWAGPPIGFTIATAELVEELYQSAESVFETILATGSGKFLDNTDLNLEMGSCRRLELEAALKELQHRTDVLDPELEANLQFLLGRDADTKGQMEQSRHYYEQSLAFWQHTPRFERIGCLLYYLGLWWRKYATQHRAEYQFACSQARNYFQECVAVFEQGNRRDLMAKFINPLGEVLQKLEQWDELEAIAKLAIQLHQTYPEPIRLAYGYGLLAEVALVEKAYRVAEIYAELALQTNAESSETACDLRHQYIDCGWSRPHYQNWYWLLLAQAKQHLGQVQDAIRILETAKVESKPQYDPSRYIRLLETLRSLYFAEGRYLEAFWIKQEQRSIEYQYGFRAFIGPGQLQPRCQVINPAIAPVDKVNTMAEEIAASGRQQDITDLILRISRTDYKLTVIHGPSGVGKSSLITAGLVPTLKQRIIGERDVLPIVLRVYTNWVSDLGQSLLRDLGTSLVTALSELRNIKLSLSEDLSGFIINQLRKNADRNLITVLIFDQIEEFFFLYTDQKTRCVLYNFLRECLNIPYVKIILSLREDYLHYLLECERCTNLDIINNNILDKKIRYYLGNFSPEGARAVIHKLNERSQLYLESALIDELVKDLAEDTGEVRPIELQVVGAQLNVETIVTLEQYQHLGPNPKQKLIERYLAGVIKDCGSEENRKIAQLILYLLTDEQNTRPLKTLADLVTGLEAAGLEIRDSNLDVVLEILVGSGIVLVVPESPADRYQLVHDYLVTFIRQQQGAELLRELENEIEQRRLAQEKFNRFLKRALVVAIIAVFGFAVQAGQSESRRRLAESQRRRAEIAEIEALSTFSSSLLLSDDQLGALVESVKVGKQLKALEQKPRKSTFGFDQIPPAIAIRTIGNLNRTVYQIQEHNRIEQHKGTFISVTFSPNSKIFASASQEGIVELWQLDGTLVKRFNVSSLKQHSERVNHLSFSPDGKIIASASANGTVRLWSVDGTLLRTLQGHTDLVNSVSFSPDGNLIASVGGNRNSEDGTEDGTVKLWSIDGTLLKTFQGHTELVNSVSFSPNGKLIASASADSTVKLWDVNGTNLRTFRGHKDRVNSVSFSPDGKLIVSASRDKTLKLWQLDGTLLKDFYGHTDKVNSVSFSPDGQSIVSGSSDHTIKLWNLDGTLIKSLKGHTNWVRGVSFSPDGRTIASVSDDNTIKLWRFHTTQPLTLKKH
ncbi:MAG TPA: AAA family ATPase, partial [Coleofasciculaceae cyanobacterium]